jgi:signal transduction histidine kinase
MLQNAGEAAGRSQMKLRSPRRLMRYLSGLRDAILSGGGTAGRLTLYIVLFSSATTILTTAVQLGLEYRADLRAIADRVDEFRLSQIPTLTNSLWMLDGALIHIQLDSLAKLPDIETLSLSVDGQVKWVAGAAVSKHTQMASFPLVHHHGGKDETIGVLEVTSSLDNVYNRIWDKALTELFNNAVKTLLVAVFALLLFQRSVTRHLYRLARYTQEIDFDEPNRPDLRLERKRRSKPDVLDILVEAVNTMRANLTAAFITSRQAEIRIRRENQILGELLRVNPLTTDQMADYFALITGKICAALEASRAEIWGRDDPPGFYSLDSYDVESRRHSHGDRWRDEQAPDYLAAVERQQFLAVADTRTDTCYAEFAAAQERRPACTAAIHAAVTQEGRLCAILTVEHAGGPRVWTADEMSFVSAVAALLAAAIAARDRQAAQRELSDYKDRLELMVATRTTELTRANAELTNTLAILQTTQAELVEREKLASLGSVVAGVAHEVNTPIGVGVTAASSLQRATEQIAVKFRGGDLKKSDLADYIDQAVLSSEILGTNLARAAELVRSFKRIAVDQSSETIGSVELGSYINDVVNSLRPQLKKGRHSIEVHATDQVVLDTTPSALWQIVSNLVMNSLLHAYGPGEHGTLQINIQRVGSTASIVYSDNGRGMPTDVRRRIFEPFFTTKRGQGGSGLGLSIVYNLVTKTLGGTISCSSAPGLGTKFTVTFPIRVSEEAAVHSL